MATADRYLAIGTQKKDSYDSVRRSNRSRWIADSLSGEHNATNSSDKAPRANRNERTVEAKTSFHASATTGETELECTVNHSMLASTIRGAHRYSTPSSGGKGLRSNRSMLDDSSETVQRAKTVTEDKAAEKTVNRITTPQQHDKDIKSSTRTKELIQSSEANGTGSRQMLSAGEQLPAKDHKQHINRSEDQERLSSSTDLKKGRIRDDIEMAKSELSDLRTRFQGHTEVSSNDARLLRMLKRGRRKSAPPLNGGVDYSLTELELPSRKFNSSALFAKLWSSSNEHLDHNRNVSSNSIASLEGSGKSERNDSNGKLKDEVERLREEIETKRRELASIESKHLAERKELMELKQNYRILKNDCEEKDRRMFATNKALAEAKLKAEDADKNIRIKQMESEKTLEGLKMLSNKATMETKRHKDDAAMPLDSSTPMRAQWKPKEHIRYLEVVIGFLAMKIEVMKLSRLDVTVRSNIHVSMTTDRAIQCHTNPKKDAQTQLNLNNRIVTTQQEEIEIDQIVTEVDGLRNELQQLSSSFVESKAEVNTLQKLSGKKDESLRVKDRENQLLASKVEELELELKSSRKPTPAEQQDEKTQRRRRSRLSCFGFGSGTEENQHWHKNNGRENEAYSTEDKTRDC